MKFRHLLIAAISTLLIFSGCSKKPPPVVEPPAPEVIEEEPMVEEEPVVEEDDSAAREAAELEAKRARLQALLDRIMSEDIYFDYDRSALTEQAKTLLAEVAGILREEVRFELTVEGHTDERGTESYNMSLGSKRAKAVQQYLVDLGIDGGRLDTISYGESAPKVDGSNEEAWAQNRRAHFNVKVK